MYLPEVLNDFLLDEMQGWAGSTVRGEEADHLLEKERAGLVESGAGDLTNQVDGQILHPLLVRGEER